jgi:cytochrome c peroxidase
MRLARRRLGGMLALACIACGGASAPPARAPATWSESKRFLLGTLRLSELPPPPGDPGNQQGDDPAAAALGERLFSDTTLSRNGQIACRTCHEPERAFTDGRPTSVGLATLRRNAPSLLDVAYVRWPFRDGRADSLWSQALVPLEAPDEMGATRTAVVRRVLGDPELTALYREAFGPPPAIRWSDLPPDAGPRGDEAERAAWRALSEPTRESVTRVFTDLGKAIAAYERTLRSRPSRFDAYVDAVLAGRPDEAEQLLDPREVAGLRVFIGRGGCLACHLGPRLTDERFHNVGTGDLGTPHEDLGRDAGRRALLEFEFNCRSPYHSDAPTADCRHLDQMMATEIQALLRGAFRTPGLRNLPATGPYMHDGRHATLEEVVAFYRSPPDKAVVMHELPRTLDLSDQDAADLAHFLRALDGGSKIPSH